MAQDKHNNQIWLVIRKIGNCRETRFPTPAGMAHDDVYYDSWNNSNILTVCFLWFSSFLFSVFSWFTTSLFILCARSSLCSSLFVCPHFLRLIVLYSFPYLISTLLHRRGVWSIDNTWLLSSSLVGFYMFWCNYLFLYFLEYTFAHAYFLPVISVSYFLIIPCHWVPYIRFITSSSALIKYFCRVLVREISFMDEYKSTSQHYRQKKSSQWHERREAITIWPIITCYLIWLLPGQQLKTCFE